jgi:hypothetical protein
MRPVARAPRERVPRSSAVDRRFVALFGAAILVASFACGDPYLHTNPYDPVYPVTVTVTGPDTLFSSFEQATYTAQTVPSFPDSAIHWGFSSLSSGRTTTIVNATPPLWPVTYTEAVQAVIGVIDTTTSLNSKTIQTNYWRHEGYKNVVFTQRVTHIQLRCPDTHACDTLSAGGAWSVWVDGFDALNHQIYVLTNATVNPTTGTPIATFISRDTTVASVTPVGIRAATVTARKSGTTWIVATRNSLLDSLQLTVR